MSRNLVLFSKLRYSNAGVFAHPISRYVHSIYSRKLQLCDFGEPLQVLKMTEEHLKPPKNNEVNSPVKQKLCHKILRYTGVISYR